MTAHRFFLQWLVISFVALLSAGTASAKPAVAVLPFKNGDAARDAIIAQLERRYEVIPGQELVDASERLGVPISRGRSLAKVAAEVGVVAIIGGGVRGRRLTLAVYSGKTGQPLATGMVPFRGRLVGKSLRRAMAVLGRGLKRAPKRMPKPRKPAPDSDTMKFTQEGLGTGEEENPLASPKPAEETKPEAVIPKEEPVVRKPREPGAPWVEGLVSLGFWLRSFSLVDPVESTRQDPKYSSGPAFSLGLAVRAKPGAFFTDNFASGFWVRLRYKQVLGLTSQTVTDTGSGTETSEALGTAMREFIFDTGYDFKLLSSPISPHIEIGVGFGLTNFSIDWPDPDLATHSMPDFSYSYLVPGLGARWYFYPMSWALLGAHLAFDYRLVFNTGEVEENDIWYGSASKGGLGFGGGVDLDMNKILVRFDYAFNYFFYSFSEAAEERVPNRRAAAGAMDAFHTLILSVGYSY